MMSQEQACPLETVLKHAISLGRKHVEVVKLLLDRGVDVNAKTGPARRPRVLPA